VALAVVATVLLFGRFSSDTALPLFGRAIGVVDAIGVLTESDEIVAALKRFRSADSIGAVVLRVDSPGGAVAPAQEIYAELLKTREVKPVLASLGNLAASGGYYIASGCDRIIANPGTLTGSIGVIMSVHNVEGLAKWAGIEETIIKSGPYKDIANPMRAITQAERSLLQRTVDDVHDQFVAAVARGRHMDPAVVGKLADGRVFSGAQALAAGMVDELGGLEETIALAARSVGMEGEPQVVHARTRRYPWWLEWLTSLTRTSSRHWLYAGLPDGPLFLYAVGDAPLR